MVSPHKDVASGRYQQAIDGFTNYLAKYPNGRNTLATTPLCEAVTIADARLVAMLLKAGILLLDAVWSPCNVKWVEIVLMVTDKFAFLLSQAQSADWHQ